MFQTWNETFEIWLVGNIRGQGVLQVDLFDEDPLKDDDPLGQVRIPLSTLTHGQEMRGWHDVLGGTGRVELWVLLMAADGDAPQGEPDDDSDEEDGHKAGRFGGSLTSSLSMIRSMVPWGKKKAEEED